MEECSTWVFWNPDQGEKQEDAQPFYEHFMGSLRDIRVDESPAYVAESIVERYFSDWDYPTLVVLRVQNQRGEVFTVEVEVIPEPTFFGTVVPNSSCTWNKFNDITKTEEVPNGRQV